MRAEDKRVDAVAVELVGVAEVLERVEDGLEDLADGLAAFERLERDRAVEDDVVGERVDHGDKVARLDGGAKRFHGAEPTP
jgi:hypothetical protein